MAPPNEDELLSSLELLYTRHDQSHVFKHIETLTPSQRTSFLHQLSTIDVATLSSKFTSANATSSSSSSISSKIAPYSGAVGLTSDPSLTSTCREIGLSALSNGETATLLLAGGQGTRLGFDGPKGMYDIDLPSHKSLFQLIAERLRTVIRLSGGPPGAGAAVPLYIMTSPLNDDVTRRYFESNDYFGLPPSDVVFFSQGVLPCLSPRGKILLETPDRVAVAPDGNGGVYPALLRSGALEDMKRRGVKYVHAFAIDNALVRPADPVFVGYCVSRGADCGNKVVWKTRPEEKVGVLAAEVAPGGACSCRVVEYSDLDVGAMQERDKLHT